MSGQAVEYAEIQMRMAANQTLANGVGTNSTATIALASTITDNGGGFLDRPNNNEVRALIACAVRVSWQFSALSTAAESGWQIDTMLNGVVVPQGEAQSSARTGVEYKSLKHTCIVNLDVNDLLSFTLTNIEALNDITLLAAGSVVLVEFVRRL